MIVWFSHIFSNLHFYIIPFLWFYTSPGCPFLTTLNVGLSHFSTSWLIYPLAVQLCYYFVFFQTWWKFSPFASGMHGGAFFFLFLSHIDFWFGIGPTRLDHLGLWMDIGKTVFDFSLILRGVYTASLPRFSAFCILVENTGLSSAGCFFESWSSRSFLKSFLDIFLDIFLEIIRS